MPDMRWDGGVMEYITREFKAPRAEHTRGKECQATGYPTVQQPGTITISPSFHGHFFLGARTIHALAGIPSTSKIVLASQRRQQLQSSQRHHGSIHPFVPISSGSAGAAPSKRKHLVSH